MNKTKTTDISSFINWLFSKYPLEKSYNSEIERLESTMKTTANCRFYAAERLILNSRITFFTTTILSLGLILIPLIQMTKIQLKLSGEVLSAIQIFLAVSVLVYSVIIKNGQYEIRSERFNKCGNDLKRLIREVRSLKQEDDNSDTHLKRVREKYSRIISNIENHSRNDYLRATLTLYDIYKVSGVIWLLKWGKYYFSLLLEHFSSLLLLLLEVLIITDMLGITKISTPLLSS
ncbi:SLATT domain-containing protein [Citrobacter amalonaticus]|uniref:SLATT domain-containing protein n=1 Tax=Citrobacter amalonaticus TaxID=35703 RepID=UPI0031F2E4E7